MSDDLRPAIPLSCARRPTAGGLVVPVVNARLADGGVDFRVRHQAKYAECWERCLCQVCETRIATRAVLLAGPKELAGGHVNEAPLCVPCALYTTRACPMVAGRMEAFAAGAPVSERKRGQRCFDPGCDCGGWRPTAEEDREADRPRRGREAHPWYALYVRPRAWQLTAEKVTTRCPDLGCEHERLVVNGALLKAPPLKVVLVSSPGEGRTWQTLCPAEVAALLAPAPAGGA